MKTQFKLALALLFMVILISIGTYIRLWNLHVRIGPFFAHHWIALVGGAYLLITISLFAYLRRFTSTKPGTLLNIHVLGNLFAVMLVSMHFAHHLGRPTEFAPDWGTGLAALTLFAFIVSTGFMIRFGLVPGKREWWHLVHVGLSLSLLVVVGIHTLKNFGLL